MKVLKEHYDIHKTKDKRRNAIRVSADELHKESSFRKLPMITDSLNNIFSLTDVVSTNSVANSPSNKNLSMTLDKSKPQLESTYGLVDIDIQQKRKLAKIKAKESFVQKHDDFTKSISLKHEHKKQVLRNILEKHKQRIQGKCELFKSYLF